MGVAAACKPNVIRFCMKLFVDSNFLSPYAMSVFVALREKQIPFEMMTLNLQRAEHRSPKYANVSRTLRVPTISEGDFSLSESSAICEYLEDKHPEVALYPKSPEQKAKAREIQAWIRSDLLPIREERYTEFVFLKRTPAPLSRAAQKAAHKLFQACEYYLSGNTQHISEEWSIVDTELALMLNRLVFAGDVVPENLAEYARFQWQRPSVQEWCNMPRPLQ